MGERKSQRKKYNISYSTLPPKQNYTDEEVKNILHKAINLIVDELIINEQIEVSKC
jgi:hypothetical protein